MDTHKPTCDYVFKIHTSCASNNHGFASPCYI